MAFRSKVRKLLPSILDDISGASYKIPFVPNFSVLSFSRDLGFALSFRLFFVKYFWWAFGVLVEVLLFLNCVCNFTTIWYSEMYCFPWHNLLRLVSMFHFGFSCFTTTFFVLLFVFTVLLIVEPFVACSCTLFCSLPQGPRWCFDLQWMLYLRAFLNYFCAVFVLSLQHVAHNSYDTFHSSSYPVFCWACLVLIVVWTLLEMICISFTFVSPSLAGELLMYWVIIKNAASWRL